VDVKEGQRAHFRIAIPADLEAQVKEALYNVSSQADFDALLQRIWPVTLDELSVEELILPDRME
jgi:hypothetical protein